MPQDEDGVMKGNGPDIAWFTDPSGNVISVIAREGQALTGVRRCETSTNGRVDARSSGCPPA